ncbi:hypothetical protein [Oxynema aestuarii]|jgi:hypothetical protein|uniref:Uncharacterized protein n=1 Tax=Oxynema aestuarii AP17 TaxID=2064643 RepID=A0A6H1U589_9CYAN|nr:hypothetical protein [Oxynema aestuarii]QIZ73203.1 hypothetical protein HCG48_23540 [Oxynema aestuarii AP17]RMH73968.1 MAG: hypothetical protein D6680_15655 [Cyanobacteria bacterium J007]
MKPRTSWRRWGAIALSTVLALSLGSRAIAERRNLVSHPRTPYRLAFYNRHNRSYRVAGALHFAHSKLHDVLLLTPFKNHSAEDAKLYAEIIDFYNNPPRIEPSMELYAPYSARATWRLFLTIDSIHLLHEMTEDIMSDADIPWNQKGKALYEAYEYYKSTYSDIALSPAPLDVTMRRAAVMMKPYFSLTRNYYPQSNNFFYAAHWWHPAVYESMMVSGNDSEQDATMQRMEDLFQAQVVPDPPLRMILSREGMPRYSRLSPETANIFDNLHMLHGITYDIFAYDGWTVEEKRAELYRVLDAMSYQPGDEKLVRKFTTPKPEINPLVYDQWVKSPEGAMSQMMLEMLDEMMPMMANSSGVHGHQTHANRETSQPHDSHDEEGENHDNHDGHRGHGNDENHHQDDDRDRQANSNLSEMTMSAEMQEMHEQLRTQLKLKLTPGIQEGEIPGSFADAMHAMMPGMEMSSHSMKAGESNPKMVEMMLEGWRQKYGDLADIEGIDMERDPSPSELSRRE